MFKCTNYAKFSAGFIILLGLVLSSCAPQTSGTGPGKMLSLEPDYKYKIEKIDISEPLKYEVDAKEMLRVAMEKALRDKDLLWSGSPGEKHYGISMRIINYEMGNAFKRWLLPSYGSTILSVHTDVMDLENKKVLSYMEHKQTIAAGGLYSVGAWKYVFDDVAKDIAIDIERKFTGKEGFYVQLDPWLEKETAPPASTVSKNICLAPFQDQRPASNIIGERTALKVSMGDIYANRDVLAYMREALQNELLASGNSLSEDENCDLVLSGNLLKFWVWTPSTPIYWDIIGEIEVKLTVTFREKGETIDKTYKAKNQTRTYVWPTEKLVTAVVGDTIKSLMYDIRKDGIWTKF